MIFCNNIPETYASFVCAEKLSHTLHIVTPTLADVENSLNKLVAKHSAWFDTEECIHISR